MIIVRTSEHTALTFDNASDFVPAAGVEYLHPLTPRAVDCTFETPGDFAAWLMTNELKVVHGREASPRMNICDAEGRFRAAAFELPEGCDTLMGLVNLIGLWNDRTFGERPDEYRGHSIVQHIRRELEEELTPDPTDMEECADIFILLAALVHQNRKLGKESLLEAVQRKMAVNYSRKWHPADTQGVFLHVKD